MNTTSVIIPYDKNKDKIILKLLSTVRYFNNISLEEIAIQMAIFHSGKDLCFEIDTAKISDFINHISDDHFVYTLTDTLKISKSERLKDTVSYKCFSLQHPEQIINIKTSGRITEIKSVKEHILIFSDTIILNKDFKLQVTQGIESLFPYLSTLEKFYTIQINAIKINHLNSQPEILYWSSRDWLISALKLEIPPPKITYSIEKNEYYFSVNS